MDDSLNPAQRRALFDIYDRCANIADLSVPGDAPEEVVAIQVDAATLDEEFERLNAEVAFALSVHVPATRLNSLRDEVLPASYRFRFPQVAA